MWTALAWLGVVVYLLIGVMAAIVHGAGWRHGPRTTMEQAQCVLAGALWPGYIAYRWWTKDRGGIH